MIMMTMLFVIGHLQISCPNMVVSWQLTKIWSHLTLCRAGVDRYHFSSVGTPLVRVNFPLDLGYIIFQISQSCFRFI